MTDGIVMYSHRKPKEKVEDRLPVDETNSEVPSAADIHDPEEVFRPRHKLSKSVEICAIYYVFIDVFCDVFWCTDATTAC